MKLTRGFSRVEQLYDVRVSEFGENLDLSCHILALLRVGQLSLLVGLNGHLISSPFVHGQPDHSI